MYFLFAVPIVQNLHGSLICLTYSTSRVWCQRHQNIEQLLPPTAFTLATNCMLFLKNTQHFPTSISCMKQLSHPSGARSNNCASTEIFSEYQIIIRCFLMYILSQELYIILTEDQSLSPYHSCVVHVETSLRMLTTFWYICIVECTRIYLIHV